MTTADDNPSRRVVGQRVRNRVIEYLELASSFDDQLEYERVAPDFVPIPEEIIEQWNDWVPGDPRQQTVFADVYSDAEVLAIKSFHETWQHVVDHTPSPMPPLRQTMALPEWNELREAASQALALFEQRGRMPEELTENR
jgi:hypothetical protein